MVGRYYPCTPAHLIQHWGPDMPVEELTTDADRTAPVASDVVVEELLVEDELLVEEVSIDGMCGVY